MGTRPAPDESGVQSQPCPTFAPATIGRKEGKHHIHSLSNNTGLEYQIVHVLPLNQARTTQKVCVIMKNCLTCTTTIHYVIVRAFILYPHRSRHNLRLTNYHKAINMILDPFEFTFELFNRCIKSLSNKIITIQQVI